MYYLNTDCWNKWNFILVWRQTAQFRYHPLSENIVSMVHDPLTLSVCWLATDQKRPGAILARVHVRSCGIPYDKSQQYRASDLRNRSYNKVLN